MWRHSVPARPAASSQESARRSVDPKRITGVRFGMGLAHSRVTAQGQISIPAEVRRKLGVGPGSILEWDQDGSAIVIRRAGRYTSEDLHQALFERGPKRKTLAELKKGIGTYVKRRHARR